MDKFRIIGGRPLEGRVAISGAKNAALPAMTAALLTDQRVVLHNIPRVRDIGTLRNLLEDLGVDSAVTHEVHGNRVEIASPQLLNPVAPYELVKQMRASVLVLGPLLARFGQARVSLPGGCAIGVRPINLHLEGLKKLGASISFDHGYVNARANGLHGAEFRFDTISVTGTENLMMAATLADGVTVLENAAREPEIQAKQDGGEDRGRGGIDNSNPRRHPATRRRTHHHSGPHRSRDISHRCGDYRRGNMGGPLQSGAPRCGPGSTERGRGTNKSGLQ